MIGAFNLEIHFHQQDEVSVFLESNLSHQQEPLGEIHLFTLYTLRQMSNLGVDQITDGLGELLLSVDDVILDFAAGHEVAGVRLIRYPGTPGVKRFSVQAHIRPDGHATLDLRPKGFGLLGRGVGYYVPTSVIVLLRFLAMRMAASPVYLRCLSRAAVACGAAQLNRQISLSNQSALALSIVRSVAGSLTDGDEDEDVDVDEVDGTESESGSDDVLDSIMESAVGCYVIEDDNGVLWTGTNQGNVFHIWSREELAQTMCKQYPGHRVSRMDFRELQQMLIDMKGTGLQKVSLDRQPNVPAKLLPIDKAILWASQAVERLESIEPSPTGPESASPWLMMCGDLFSQFNLPASWVRLNTEAEQRARHCLKRTFDPAKADPLAGDLPERLQRSLYTYFATFSRVMCSAFHPEYDLAVYKDRLCCLSVEDYLRLCGALYSASIISVERDDPSSARLQLGAGAIMCGLPKSYIEWWLECCSLAKQEPEFLSEVSSRLYREAATVLQLATDDEAMKRARTHSIWNGVIASISQLHADYMQNEACLQFVDQALA